MRITTIAITKSRTVNIGNFESVRVEFGATAELEYGEDYNRCVAELEAHVTHEVESRCPQPAASVKAPAGYVAPREPIPMPEEYKPAANATHPPMSQQGVQAPPKRKRRTKEEIAADAIAEYQAKMSIPAPMSTGPADVSALQPDDGRYATGRSVKVENAPQPGAVPAVGRTVGATETQVTFPDVQAAVMAYLRSFGSSAMTKLIKDHTGSASLLSAKPETWAALYAAAGGDPLAKKAA